MTKSMLLVKPNIFHSKNINMGEENASSVYSIIVSLSPPLYSNICEQIVIHLFMSSFFKNAVVSNLNLPLGGSVKLP